MHGRSFAQMAGAFIEHADLVREVSAGQRRNYKEKWSLLKEHFDGVKVTDVDTKFLLALREKRSQKQTHTGAAVKPATLKKDIDFIRLVLRQRDIVPTGGVRAAIAWRLTSSAQPQTRSFWA